MENQFLRTEMLLGAQTVSRLRAKHVIVFGLGGVGGYAAETLARSGIGTLTLVDFDVIGITNLNRQLCALHSTLGQSKAEVTAQRARDINPEIIAIPRFERYSADVRDKFFNTHYDYIIDAIDLVSCKLDIIITGKSLGIPIISALGTGNKTDISKLTVTDISLTKMCPFARVMRKELRRRGIISHKVVYSPEPAQTPEITTELPPPGRRSIPSSVPWLPAAAGLMLGAEAVSDLKNMP